MILKTVPFWMKDIWGCKRFRGQPFSTKGCAKSQFEIKVKEKQFPHSPFS